jgi:hypothetical protein
MAAIARDLASAPARHWAARPLPEPPRYRRVSKSAPAPVDRLGRLLEDWMRELPVGNTLEGD